MNYRNRYRSLFLFVGMLAILTVLGLSAFAQDTGTNLSIQTSGMAAVDWHDKLLALVMGNPKLSVVMLFLAAARPFIKGLMSWLDGYVKDNCAPAQYAELVHYETSTWFKAFTWLLDCTTSIKLPVIGAAIGIGATKPAEDKPVVNSAKLGLILLLLLPALCFTGCANTSANAVAYKSESAVNISATTAMHLWNDYLAQNKVPAATELKVRDAYRKYQACMLLVIDASETIASAQVVLSSAKTNAPPAASLDSPEIHTALANASAALADLINLLRTLGVKL